jgi:lipoprotein-releasing system permease protein
MSYFLPFFLGFRYLRTKKRSGFVSFITLASVIGIALGVTVLITVLSVMNGFDNEIRHHIFDIASHVTISNDAGAISDWQTLLTKIKKNPKVVSAAPFVNGEGMLSLNGEVMGVLINGITPDQEKSVSGLDKKMVEGKFSSLKPESFNVLLGMDLISRFGGIIGNKITLITPEATLTPLGIMPRFKRLNISGIFHIDGGIGFDSGMVFVNLKDAQKLFSLGDAVSGIRIRVNDLYDAPGVAKTLKNNLGSQYLVKDWTAQYGALFKAIQMEKTMMFIILLFIIAVAVFNLVSTLVMVVNEKQSEIAILRTLGATPKTIMATFMVQGGTIGLVGTLLGVIFGILLASNATEIVALIEQLFHVKFISSSVYFIDYLPSKLEWKDILHISLSAAILSLVATIYPAWNASKVRPAEALRYE